MKIDLNPDYLAAVCKIIREKPSTAVLEYIAADAIREYLRLMEKTVIGLRFPVVNGIPIEYDPAIHKFTGSATTPDGYSGGYKIGIDYTDDLKYVAVAIARADGEVERNINEHTVAEYMPHAIAASAVIAKMPKQITSEMIHRGAIACSQWRNDKTLPAPAWGTLSPRVKAAYTAQALKCLCAALRVEDK